MKLSEMIWNGSKKTPQNYGDMSDFKGTKTCALGASLHEYYGHIPKRYQIFTEWNRDLGYILDYSAVFPCDEHHSCPLRGFVNDVRSIIAHLNDKHFWTREAIAMWVESIENEIDKKAQEKNSQVVNGNSVINRETEVAEKEAVDVYDDIFENAGV